VLLHIAWLQPTPSPEHTKIVHLFASPLSKLAPDEPLVTQYTEPPYDPFQTWRLDGTLSLSKLNYFQLDLNLGVNIPIKELSQKYLDYRQMNNPSQANLTNFRLIQHRRMRVNELHYLDHPLFGVLAKVVPYNASHS